MAEDTIIFDLEEEAPQDHTGPVLQATTQTLDLSVSTEHLSDSGSFLTDDLDFQKFMSLMPNLIFLLEKNSQIVFANRVAHEYMMLGDVESFMDMLMTDLTQDERAKKALSTAVDTVMTNKRPRVVECLLKIGSKALWAKSTFSPVRVGKSRIVMCVIQDLSNEKITECKLIKEQKQTVEAKEEAARAVAKAESLQIVRDVSAGVVHNFNNVLSVMTTASYLIDQTDDLDTIRRQTARIKEAATQATSMVSRMASFVRSLSYHGRFTEINLSSLVTSGIEFARPFWQDIPKQRGYVITVKNKIDPNIKVMGIEQELSETILNLIKNACESMTEGGTLFVSLKAGMGSVILQISDTGRGVPKEIASKIFSPFFTTKGQRGTGMGLATCKQTIEKHNGSISFSSSSGQTTFTITLPDNL